MKRFPLPKTHIEQKIPRTRIVVATNSLTSTTQPAYSNHCQMWYLFGKHYPNVDFCFVNPPRMSIDRMRNLAAETAMNIGASHLLFIDDDVLLPQPFDFLDKLLAHDADIAAADVLIRGYPFNHMIFKWIDKEKTGMMPLSKIPRKKGVIECGAVGFSVCLIKTDLIRKMTRPYFVTGVSNTEDIYFCIKADDEVPGVRIIADTTITCGHILWAEIIDEHNKKNYTKYWEAQFGKPEIQNPDRGNEYLAGVKGVINARKKTPKA